MKYKITHITTYNYEYDVSFCHNRAILMPREIDGQSLIDFKFEISPNPTEINHYVDFFGNNVTHFLIQESHQELSVSSTSVIERDASVTLEGYTTFDCKKVTLESGLKLLDQRDIATMEALNYILESNKIPVTLDVVKKYALESFQPNRSIFEAAYELNQRIFADFKFESGVTDVVTPVNELFKIKKGVCQDFTHVALACIRSIGLPARYVSGYIETIPPKGQEKLVGTDASHAWFSIYIPSFGWVEFDPTNDLIPENQHITVAYGRDYSDITPLRGVVYSAGDNEVSVSVDVQRL